MVILPTKPREKSNLTLTLKIYFIISLRYPKRRDFGGHLIIHHIFLFVKPIILNVVLFENLNICQQK